MDLIEEIRKAEKKAESIRKDAEIKGQKTVDEVKVNAEQEILALGQDQDRLLKKELAEARKIAEKEIDKLQKECEKKSENLKISYKTKKETAIKKIQEIILKWPLSQ